MEWRGLIAAILAGGMALTLVIGVTGAVWQGRPIGERGGEVLVGIFVAMGTAIGVYLAARNSHKDDK